MPFPRKPHFLLRNLGLTCLVCFSGCEPPVPPERDLLLTTATTGGTYPGQDKPVRTIAQPNILAVSSEVDEEIIYRLVQ